jgi:hypothetical protein
VHIWQAAQANLRDDAVYVIASRRLQGGGLTEYLR